MKNIFTFGARVLLAIVLVSAFVGCGGGGSNPIVTPDQPVYRLQVVLDQDVIYGGEVVNDVVVEQGTQRRFWVRLESRVGDNPWTIVTQQVKLDVTIEGSPSGIWMADVGLTGGQSWALAGQSRLEFQPPIGGHFGTAKLKLSVPEFGAFVHLWVTIVAPVVGPPPAAQTCRDFHPAREAIGGFWWDCVSGVWQNTGEPVDQPPTCRELHPNREIINGFWWDCISGVWQNTGEVAYQTGELYAYGAQGEFWDAAGIIDVEQGNGYRFEWYLNDSKVSGSDITFNSKVLPSWCWNGVTSEFVTILWAEPEDPDLEDPGNMIVIPGSYSVRFTYKNHVANCDGTINVLRREGLSLKGLRVKPHPIYKNVLVTY